MKPPIFIPRKPVCEKQCENCPFRKDGGVLKDNQFGRMMIRSSVASGIEFYCHESVYKDKVTPELIEDDKAPKNPESEWRFCKGAYAFKTKLLNDRFQALKSNG